LLLKGWPFFTIISTLRFLTRTIWIFFTKENKIILIRTILITLILIQWWKNISLERTIQGFHRHKVIFGLQAGIILFIISEILFFFSFFWTFFHNSLSPNIEIGNNWPPININTINPYQIPFLNTVVLLSSGIVVTLAHHNLIKKNNKKIEFFIICTLFLGIYFTFLQIWEYINRFYCIRDSRFGSTFFLATGFHGIHVIIGTFFLIVRTLRFKINYFSKKHHFNIEAASWYWHFVDVVWLFLYIFLYWWSY